MSEQHYVITISRQFGSLGRSIAQKTSELLGIYFMDRDIVEETSKRMGLQASEIGDREESSKTASSYYYRKFPLGIAPTPVEDEIFEVQSNIIRDCAARQDCIIVGRCAEYVLRNHERRLSFYIRAPYEARLQNCVETLHMKSDEAQKMIHDVDIARAYYRRRYISTLDRLPDYTDCDIILDSSRFGVDPFCPDHRGDRTFGARDLRAGMTGQRSGARGDSRGRPAASEASDRILQVSSHRPPGP